jgi:hypothetical protein
LGCMSRSTSSCTMFHTRRPAAWQTRRHNGKLHLAGMQAKHLACGCRAVMHIPAAWRPRATIQANSRHVPVKLYWVQSLVLCACTYPATSMTLYLAAVCGLGQHLLGRLTHCLDMHVLQSAQLVVCAAGLTL